MSPRCSFALVLLLAPACGDDDSGATEAGTDATATTTPGESASASQTSGDDPTTGGPTTGGDDGTTTDDEPGTGTTTGPDTGAPSTTGETGETGEPPDTASRVAYLTRNLDGQTWPEDIADEADICPAGWAYLGGTSFAAACLPVLQDEDNLLPAHKGCNSAKGGPKDTDGINPRRIGDCPGAPLCKERKAT